MTKDVLHADSLDDVIGTAPIRPVPERGMPLTRIYAGLGSVYAVERRIAWLMRVIMFAAIIALGLLMATQVFMRYVISAPFLGIEELAPLLAVWVYFLGMAYGSRERDHIEGGMMTLVIKSPRVLTALRLLGSVATLVTVVIFLRFAWDFVAFNWSVGRRSTYMRLPKVLWDISLLIGLALMTFYAALQALAEMRALFIPTERRK